MLVLSVAAGLVGAPFRPAQMALLPSLAKTPHELTAANAVSSTLESLSFFLGPAIAGLLLSATNASAVFVLNALTFVWSAVLLSGLPAGDRKPATVVPPRPPTCWPTRPPVSGSSGRTAVCCWSPSCAAGRPSSPERRPSSAC